MIKQRKVLVFGAGVIGAYLAHVLIEAGNDVTILAREERAKSLNENGLVIYHHLQKKTTTNKVKALTDVEGLAFDATFVVMPYHKLRSALPLICTFNTKLLVLVGNNLSSAEFFSVFRFPEEKRKKRAMYVRDSEQAGWISVSSMVRQMPV